MNVTHPKAQGKLILRQALFYLYPVALVAAATGLLLLFGSSQKV
jgi:hypothetical protein